MRKFSQRHLLGIKGLTREDIELVFETADNFKAIINPLVNLIWLAGIVFLLGSLVTLWPDAREERRLALRYGRLPQEA